MRILTTYIAALLTVFAGFSQTVVTGETFDQTKKPLEKCEVAFLSADSVVAMAFTDSKGRFEIKGIPHGTYVCHVAKPGFLEMERDVTLSGSSMKLPRFILIRDTVRTLEEVSVSAGKQLRAKDFAGMTEYYLSDWARKQTSSYLALSEIPRLVINPVMKTISLDDGSRPLILFDGVKKDQYLDVLRPEMIEAVEVIDNPSARYRRSASVTSVINIRLKKRSGLKPYIQGNVEANVMHNLKFLFGSANAEIGNSNSALSLVANDFLMNKIKSDSYDRTTTSTLERSVWSDPRHVYNSTYLSLNADKVLNDKNYISLNATAGFNPNKIKDTLTGTVRDLVNNRETPLTGTVNGKDNYNSFRADIYYKHTFKPGSTLELTGDYAYSMGSSNLTRTEENELYPQLSKIDLDNTQHYGRFDIDYSLSIKKAGKLVVGSSTDYSHINIDDLLDSWPVYKYRQTTEYLYAGFDNNSTGSKFNYNVSLGSNMVFSNADGRHHTYVDFVPAVNLLYRFNAHHALGFRYTRSRTMPTPSQLNPRNVSTDEFQIQKGNPDLEPSHVDLLYLHYRMYFGGLRITPFMQYFHYSDLIIASGSLDGDRYTNTYMNLGHQNRLVAGAMTSYSMPCGFVGFNAWYEKWYIPGCPYSGNTYKLQLNANLHYKMFSLSAFIEYDPYQYTLYSKVKSSVFSNCSLNCSINDKWTVYITAENPIFCKSRIKTWVQNGDYSSYNIYRQAGYRPRVMIGFRFSFSNKINHKYRQKKYFNDPKKTDIQDITAK